MGRVTSDGAWYFLIADIATLSNHQRQGPGIAILGRMLQEFESKALPKPYIRLVADPQEVQLYEKFGFKAVTQSIGMSK